jgi:hypothetical protein
MKKNLIIALLAVLTVLSVTYCLVLRKERNTYKDLSVQYLLQADSLSAVIAKEKARTKEAYDLAMAEYEQARMAAEDGGADQD